MDLYSFPMLLALVALVTGFLAPLLLGRPKAPRDDDDCSPSHAHTRGKP